MVFYNGLACARVACPERAALAQVSLTLLIHFSNRGVYDQAIVFGKRALALATASGDVLLHAQAHLALGVAYHDQGDFRRAIDHCSQTAVVFDEARCHEHVGRFITLLPAVHSRALLAWNYPEMGRFAEGRALGDAGLRMAEAMAHPMSLMWACYGLARLSLRQGDLPRALRLCERAMGICRDADLPLYFPIVARVLGTGICPRSARR